MGIDDNVGSEFSIDINIKRACDSDILKDIECVINGDRNRLEQALKYLSDKDDVSMRLRLMTLPISDPHALMVALMALDSTDAPKIDRLCHDGLNPVLQFSMCKGMEVLIRVIAHAHANLDIVGVGGHTPLTLACENGLTDTVKMLINNGASAFDKCEDSGFAPLHYACQLGDAEMVKSLISAGADVNVMSADKLMPIHLAISTVQAAQMSPTAPNGVPWSVQGALMCIQHLANNGADLNYVCPYGFSGMSFLRMVGTVQ